MLWWLDQVGFVMCTCRPSNESGGLPSPPGNNAWLSIHPFLQNTGVVISHLLVKHTVYDFFLCLQHKGDVADASCLQNTGNVTLYLLVKDRGRYFTLPCKTQVQVRRCEQHLASLTASNVKQQEVSWRRINPGAWKDRVAALNAWRDSSKWMQRGHDACRDCLGEFVEAQAKHALM